MARDTNFYYSFLVLPARKREAIIAVWDFCRAVDDAVDVQGVNAPAELQRWREELAHVFDGGSPSTRQGNALQPFVRQFHLPRASFEALIEGVEMDLHTSRYGTFAELYEYCVRVASAVGLICVEIFGYRDPGTRQYAIDLGVALQLTNILRDVPEDLARDRLYLPMEDLARFGCDEEDLRAEIANAGGGVRSTAVRNLLAFEAERAHDYYARASRALPRDDARKLVAAEIMGGVYSAILRRIERRGYDIFSHVVRVPRPERAVIAARIWLRVALLGR